MDRGATDLDEHAGRAGADHPQLGTGADALGGEERSVVMILYPLFLGYLIMGTGLAFVYQPMPVGDLGLLAVMAVLAMFGKLRFPGQKQINSRRCPSCGRFRIGKGPCACKKGDRGK